jgi:hypothetical protein
VPVFKEVCLKDVIHWMSSSLRIKEVKFYIKILRPMLKYKIMKKLFMLNYAFVCSVYGGAVKTETALLCQLVSL